MPAATDSWTETAVRNRSLLLSREKTYSRKIAEALLSYRLERVLSKEEILAIYLNVAPYGNQYAGAEAASRGYFGCPAQNLTPAQAAWRPAPGRHSAWEVTVHAAYWKYAAWRRLTGRVSSHSLKRTR